MSWNVCEYVSLPLAGVCQVFSCAGLGGLCFEVQAALSGQLARDVMFRVENLDSVS